MNGSNTRLRVLNVRAERLCVVWRRRVWASMLSTVVALAVLVTRGSAQNQDVSAQFPDPAKVTADYPDDAERWGAFNVLRAALNNAAPTPMSKTAYAKFFAYESSYNAITTAKMADRQAYKDFNTRCDQLFSNTNFAHSVLEKYRLTAFARRAPPPAQNTAVTSPPAARNPFPVQTQEPNPINDAWPYPRAFPLLLFFLVPVAFCTWVVLQLTGSGHSLLPTRPPVPGGLPALPESLRVVSVPGARYAVYVLSGIVLQKEENIHAYTYTTATTGTQNVPGTVTTHTETTVEQIIWVRTPQNTEQPWTLYNSDLRLRPGQILSVLVRPLPKDTGDILLAYNHTTGTLEKCPAMQKAHGNQGFIRREIVQWSANLACGVGSAIVTAFYLPMFAGGSLYAGFLVWWLFGSLVLVTLSFLVVTPLMTRLTLKRRDAAFDRKYLPGLRQFFEQGTPFLQRTFARS